MNENIWDSIKRWYSKNGISTEQFFADNSTEMGRDEMLLDFTYRAIKSLPELEQQLEKKDQILKSEAMLNTSLGRQVKELEQKLAKTMQDCTEVVSLFASKNKELEANLAYSESRLVERIAQNEHLDQREVGYRKQLSDRQDELNYLVGKVEELEQRLVEAEEKYLNACVIVKTNGDLLKARLREAEATIQELRNLGSHNEVVKVVVDNYFEKFKGNE